MGRKKKLFAGAAKRQVSRARVGKLTVGPSRTAMKTREGVVDPTLVPPRRRRPTPVAQQRGRTKLGLGRFDAPILQCRVSPVIRFFQTAFLKTYGLKNYHTSRQPAFFLGCYPQDIKAINSHRSIAVIIWGGSDAIRLRSRAAIRRVASKANVFNVASSNFIAADLEAAGIPYKHLPVCATDPSPYSPCPMGDSVYAYVANSHPEFYGGSTIDILARETGIPIIRCNHQTFTRSQMAEVYSRCFIGLRLVPHDANSCTAIELGLMGRRVVWNGGSPNAIPYRSFSDIMEAIRVERERKGHEEEIARLTREYINIGNDWKAVRWHSGS